MNFVPVLGRSLSNLFIAIVVWICPETTQGATVHIGMYLCVF